MYDSRKNATYCGFARLDPAIANAGLFRSLARGEREKEFSFKYPFNEHETLRFECPHTLGCDDLRIFFSLAALVTRYSTKLNAESGHRADAMLQQGLALQGATTGNIAVVRTSLRRIALEAGYSKSSAVGKMLPLIKESLLRLASMRVTSTDENGSNVCNLISIATQGDSWLIAFCPRLSKAAKPSARESVQYLAVDMDNFRRINSDVARVMASRLLWINQGSSSAQAIGVDTFVDYVWPDKAKGSIRHSRRHKIKGGIEELNAAQWKFQPSNDRYYVKRPASVEGMATRLPKGRSACSQSESETPLHIGNVMPENASEIEFPFQESAGDDICLSNGAVHGLVGRPVFADSNRIDPKKYDFSVCGWEQKWAH